jgi:signal transduction histidine kinase/ActR/RegA family two-component response regulator
MQPPPLGIATVVIVALTAFWAWLRLGVFPEHFIPLTYVIPLLAAVWTRRRTHVWGMAAVFAACVAYKASRLDTDGIPLNPAERLFVGATFINILIGATIVHVLIHFRGRLDEQRELVLAQNAELEAQAEELGQQNEEIRAQSEELAQQNEEINAQAEELARQNDELHHANDRLGVREQLLEGLLHASRDSGDGALDAVCQRALALIGAPATQLVLLEHDGQPQLKATAQAGSEAPNALPARWPLERSLAGLVWRSDRTAYVSDLATQPDLAAPFPPDGALRSILATPLRIEGAPIGVLAVGSPTPGHWTEEQFRLLEWIGALCSQLIRALRAREALAGRSRELEAANRAKDDFLAMLSHELRTPLTPVLAVAGVLASDSRLPADAREDLAMIRRNVNLQSRLIDDLLDLTRIERRKLELNLQPCSPALLLRDAAAIAGPDLDAREQTLVVRCDVPDHWRIPGDPVRLPQVLWNLLQNATKFSPVRSRIQLSARVAPGGSPRVELVVEDEGPGVPAAEQERIFRPFEQVLKHRRVGREAGLGLGLAIARAIVELHGGRLTVSAGPDGRGARFSADLPLMPAGAAIPDAPTQRVEAAPGSRDARHILLVEDHQDTGRVIAQLLKGSGHTVVHATTAADALACFARGSFDLLVSDIGLPDESGLVLMRRLRELQPDLPGVCMTGYGMESDQRACLEAGFGEHLAKPVDVQRLLAAINRAARPRDRLART